MTTHRTSRFSIHAAPLANLVPAARLKVIKASQVEMPLMELSSTDLRQRASDGRSLRYRTPRAVEKYIETQALYRR